MSQRGRAWVAWIVSWVAYASYYAGRKGFAVSKKAIRDQLGVGERALGRIDTSYLAAYALGQFVNGWFGDHLGARRLVSIGLLASALACAAFGAFGSSVAFGAAYLANGFAQSTGWPGTTRAMAEWTTSENRGTVMAFWATCYQVGGIAAGWASAELLGAYGWRSTFFVPALWMALVGLLVFAFLRPGPGAALVEAPSDEKLSALESDERRAAQRAVMRSRTLWSFGSSYFFIKFIRYALLFWLPYYLSTALGYEGRTAGRVSVSFEVGGIVGVIAIGTLSDRLKHLSRPLLSAISLIGLTLALLLYLDVSKDGVAANVIALGLVGAALFAPDSLLSGAAAQDAGGPYAAATATGMVNGVGSIGGMVSGLALPELSARFGWQSLFPVLVALAACSVLALVPALLARPKPASA